MTFIEAMQALVDGKPVQRKGQKAFQVLAVLGKKNLMTIYQDDQDDPAARYRDNMMDYAIFRTDDLFATDWRVVD
jgi:hypothetical protein